MISRFFDIFWKRIKAVMLRITRHILTGKAYIRFAFFLNVGYKLDLENPRSFNEKLQWLKFNDIRPEYEKMVDKIEVKYYVASIVGEKYIIPTIGTWDRIEDIDWNNLPQRFVLKATNDSGGVVVCKDKSSLDADATLSKLKKSAVRPYSNYNQEYPYTNVKCRFIAEEYLEDESGYELKDYKIFCSYGKPLFLFVASGRQQHDTRFDFYDLDFNHLPVLNGHPNADVPPVRPENFEEMLEVASKLSVGIPQVRIDLYNVNGRIYFGEITFFHWSGMKPFEPREWDYKFGSMIDLPEVKE